MSKQTLCRWGILGTANIARKNWKAIHLAGNSTLIAVASRQMSRSEQFIDECQSEVPFSTRPTPCGSYEDLLARSDIDAVYIPLPTGIRKDWVLRAAAAGKHILCEKPCAISSADLRTMLDACKEHRVQFMDGVMFMHSRRLPQLRQTLNDDHSIGQVRRIASAFSFLAPEEFMTQNIRVSNELEPLGCLGDLGWYNIRFSLWTMREALPHRVTGRILSQHARPDSREPVPTEFSGELFFAGGTSATFYCSFITENHQWAHVSGTKGYAFVEDFVLPFFGSSVGFEVNAPRMRVQGCDFNMENHARRLAVDEYSSGTSNAQETNMIRTFANHVLSGEIEPFWSETAWKTQLVLEACLKSANDNSNVVSIS